MRRMGVLLAAILLVGAACGSDDDEGPVATNSPPATPVATDPPPATPVAGDPEPPATPVATDPEPPATPVATDDGGMDALGPIPTGDSGSPWCRAADEVEMAFDGLDDIDFNQPVTLESEYRLIHGALEEAERWAPIELEGDVTVNIEAIEIFIAELEKVRWRYADANLSALAAIEAELSESGRAIDRYNFYVCNFDNGYDPNEELGGETDDAPVFGSGSIRDQAIAALVEQGFTPDEAGCVGNRIVTLGIDITTTAVDPGVFLQLLRDCDVSTELITLYGG